MARLVALEWTDQEARVAVASSRGRSVSVEQAFSVSMRPSQPGDAQPSVDPGQRIATALAARGLSRLDALVAVGRTSIELRQLTVPPAPDEELPDMVRFQALREFNAMQEDWALDYVPIDDDPSQPRNVMAAAMAPEQIQEVQKVCQAAGLKPRRLVLRSCSAASLFFRRQTDGRSTVRLLVDLLDDETDLTVMIDRKVIFIRTARLAFDPLADADSAQGLLAELRRTMAAVQNQLGGRRVESLVLCGAGDKHSALAELISQRLAVPVEVFDPFAELNLAGDARKALPEQPGRFAPLLGMLVDELQGDAHAVDFLHPRKRPEPPSRRRMYIASATALVLVIGLVFGYVHLKRSQAQEELKDIKEQVAALEKNLAEMKTTTAMVDAIDDWRSGDAVWLDELKWLAEVFPPAKEALLTELRLSHDRTRPQIIMQILSSASDVVSKMEQKLRDANHYVASGSGIREASNKAFPSYTWQFARTVAVGQEGSAAKGKVPAKKLPAREKLPLKGEL